MNCFPKTVEGKHWQMADAHWRMGKGTKQIARIMSARETEVIKWLDSARSLRRRLPRVQYESGKFAGRS